MTLTIRSRIAALFWSNANGDTATGWVSKGISVLIVVNVLLVILESVEQIREPFEYGFRIVEFVSVVAFTAEYVLRLWSCVEVERFRRPFLGRLRYATTLLAIVDLLAVVPAFLPMFIEADFRFLRSLRLIRLFRVMKLARYSKALQMLGRVLRDVRDELAVTFFVLAILLIMCGGLIYFAERNAQPETFSSIPAAMWYGIVTLTTVGYGDIYPVTIAGKLLGSVMAVLGIGLFALPTGIISSGYLEEMGKSRRSNVHEPPVCPHCGKRLTAND